MEAEGFICLSLIFSWLSQDECSS